MPAKFSMTRAGLFLNIDICYFYNYNEDNICSSLGLTAIHCFTNLFTHEQVEQIRAQFGFDSEVINNIAPDEIIDHLNTKLQVWQEKYSFAEMIETAISKFPGETKFGTYHRFAGYFTFMDMLGYWKDSLTDNSNIARLWDAARAFFA